MNVQEAGDFPRIHHTGSSEPTGEVMKTGGILNLESQFPYKTIRTLMRRGHRIQYANGPYGGYQAIKRSENGVYWGASESRKDGQAAGFLTDLKLYSQELIDIEILPKCFFSS